MVPASLILQILLPAAFSSAERRAAFPDCHSTPHGKPLIVWLCVQAGTSLLALLVAATLLTQPGVALLLLAALLVVSGDPRACQLSICADRDLARSTPLPQSGRLTSSCTAGAPIMGTEAPAKHAEGTRPSKPVLDLGFVNTQSGLIKTSPRPDSQAPSPSDSASCTTTASSPSANSLLAPAPAPAAKQQAVPDLHDLFGQLEAQAAQLHLHAPASPVLSQAASSTSSYKSESPTQPAALSLRAQFQQLQAQAAQLALRPQQPSPNSGASSLRYASEYCIESAASAEDSQPWDLQGGRSTDAEQLQLIGRCLGEVRCLLSALLTCT